MSILKVVGWGAGIDEFVEVPSHGGWGSGITKDLELGRNKHELGVYKNGHLIKLFRTDVPEFVRIIESEAKRYAQRLRQKDEDDPNRKVPANIFSVNLIY